jgi:DNA-binding NarL/FixJ family response regulator
MSIQRLRKKINLLLVDDHEVVRMGNRMILSREDDIDIVAEVERGEDAIQTYLELRPTITLMDLSMPGIGGLAATKRILELDPKAKIIIFSMHDQPEYIRRAQEIGARAYVNKNDATERLVTTIREVASKDDLEAPLATSPPLQEDLRLLQTLTDREFLMFELLARGLSVPDAAQELGITSKTASNYTTIIKDKLQLKTTGDIVLFAINHQLTLSGLKL